MKLRALFLLLISLFSVLSFGQGPSIDPIEAGQVTWTASLKDGDLRAGETTQIIISGKLLPGWHVFGPQLTGDWVSITTDMSQEGNAAEATGDPIFPAGVVKNVPGFEKPGVWYDDAMAFAVPIRIKAGLAGEQIVKLQVRAQTCDDSSCDRPRRVEIEIPITLASGEARADRTEPVTGLPAQPEGYIVPTDDVSSDNPDVMAKAKGETGAAPEAGAEATDQFRSDVENARSAGLLPFLALSFGAGLLALLTPCVWPMIPITVSFFTKKASQGKKVVLTSALAYCLGIVGTFVALGLIVTLAFGATGVQQLAASPIANLFLGVLFVVLALNLFGVFEIIIPSKFVNEAQNKAGKGGWVAPVLLGFVFSLTTFTCTVPFVGTILVSATTGDILYPVLGMTAFSLAFAIPFFILAMLPQGLSKLPKSGTWLNAVKAYMGFLELAAAAKFFSNVDVILNDPIWVPFAAYAAIWFSVFIAAAMYLFGWVKTPHDKGDNVGWGRRIFGFVNVGIAIWILSGISNPGNLGSALAFFPPDNKSSAQTGITWIMTYEEGMAKAREENKPVFINFTGKTCGNCRVMEYQRFPMPKYREQLDKFVRIELFTDRETPEDEANAKLREEMTKSATNPAYAVLKPDGTVLEIYQGMASTDEHFIEFMKRGYDKATQ